MKLLNHTTKYFAFLSIVLISVWAVIFYFAMIDEVYDSLDDGLENQKMLIIQEAENDSTVLNTTEFGIGNFIIEKTGSKNRERFKDRYRDTLMYMQNEEEYEPVRILESVFEHRDNYYKIKVITSMVEEDDQIENLIQYLVGLYFLLLTSIIILNNLVLKKVWRPFYELIGRLRDFRIERDDPITSKPTHINEFALLNKSVERLTQKSRDTYNAQKEFIENAAHELQTPLAISINKLELLLEKSEMDEGPSQEVAAVLENLGRLTRLNRSLLLLSKIDNSQYVEEDTIDFTALAHKIAADFEDFAAHRNILLKIEAQTDLQYPMNSDLATIMMTNLIKNAIVHGSTGKTVNIDISANTLAVKNFGAPIDTDTVALFKRFKKTGSTKRSTGLGLSIAWAVADRYGLRLNYFFTDRHVFELGFPSNGTHP